MDNEQERNGDNHLCAGHHACDEETPCDRPKCESGRRALLGTMAAGSSIALAGCVGIFGTPGTSQAPTVGIEDEFDIEYLNEEGTIQVRGDQPLLEAGEEQGWELPYFCRTGFCGQCLAHVDGDGHELVDMTINEFDPLDDEAIEEGYVLTCTGYPRDDFAIETGKAGALQQIEEEEEADTGNDDESATGITHAVDYVKQRWTIEVPEDQSLLVAGEERGFDLPFGCREGWCGQCLGQVDGDTHELVEMTVNNYEPLDDEAMDEGYTLTCQGHARADFALETGKFEEEGWEKGTPP